MSLFTPEQIAIAQSTLDSAPPLEIKEVEPRPVDGSSVKPVAQGNSEEKQEEKEGRVVYQGHAGEMVFLHPFNVACLSEGRSIDDLPDVIEVQQTLCLAMFCWGSGRSLVSCGDQVPVCEVSVFTLTPSIRRKYSSLAHIPVSALMEP